ncbi:hypothetical protein ACFY5D_10360 [Paeniglutamicibacter sp. NPDC012692]|uniref:hypothetical protein n=1 Tax=Paeniglutamicibacter sp. NPDC012692 TaxID=3364388 RepID=UPI00369977EE
MNIQHGVSGSSFVHAPEADPAARVMVQREQRKDNLALVQFRDIAERAAAKLAAACVVEGLLECLGQANDAMDETSKMLNHGEQNRSSTRSSQRAMDITCWCEGSISLESE